MAKTATTTAAPKRRRRSTPDSVTIIIPERFREIIGEVNGVEGLKAVHYCSEGERVGRMGGELGDELRDMQEQLREIRMAMVGLIERMTSDQDTPARNTAPAGDFGPDAIIPPTRRRHTTPGAEDAAIPAGILPKDAKIAYDHAMQICGGDKGLATMAYERVMEDANQSGTFGSRGPQARIAAVMQAIVNARSEGFETEGFETAGENDTEDPLGLHQDEAGAYDDGTEN